MLDFLSLDWAPNENGCILWNNIWFGNVADLEECKQKCMKSMSLCCSVEFNTIIKRCNHQRVTRITVEPKSAFHMPCHVKGYVYTDRMDAACAGKYVDPQIQSSGRISKCFAQIQTSEPIWVILVALERGRVSIPSDRFATRMSSERGSYSLVCNFFKIL